MKTLGGFQWLALAMILEAKFRRPRPFAPTAAPLAANIIEGPTPEKRRSRNKRAVQ